MQASEPSLAVLLPPSLTRLVLRGFCAPQRCLAGLRHRAGLVELALHLPQLLTLPPLPPSLERLDMRSGHRCFARCC